MKIYLIKYLLTFMVTGTIAVLYCIHVVNYNLDLAGYSLLVVFSAFFTAFLVWLIGATYRFFTSRSAKL